ncbi:phage scaffolding protein [Streptomyces sp. MMBL 11-1]|uniref:phage scaffolding protein n=1 Tax=Streptomyces sp. MMBL 11-1 TaxID=3026420 RepID=UPI00235FB3F0|nr:phage scaffolding protein [Streptomyces sp. MMBL 11-1]
MNPNTLPRHIVGYRKARPGESLDELYPIYPIAGGAPDDEDVDGDEEGGEDDDAEDVDDGDDKDAWKAPTEYEWKKVQRALKRANKEAADLRGKSGTDAASAVEETERKAREEATQEAESRWKPMLVKQAARAALAEAGLIKNPNRLLRMLEMDDIEVSEDGEIEGLDEQIHDFKKEFPEFFGRRSAKDVDGGDKALRRGADKASATLIARALTGGR